MILKYLWDSINYIDKITDRINYIYKITDSKKQIGLIIDYKKRWKEHEKAGEDLLSYRAIQIKVLDLK